MIDLLVVLLKVLLLAIGICGLIKAFNLAMGMASLFTILGWRNPNTDRR